MIANRTPLYCASTSVLLAHLCVGRDAVVVVVVADTALETQSQRRAIASMAL